MSSGAAGRAGLRGPGCGLGRGPGRGGDREAGTLSIFVAICATMLLMLTGLVLDGGGRLRAVERADSLAQEAARAGGQQIDRAALLRGQGLKYDRQAAVDAVVHYLGANGIDSQDVNASDNANDTVLTVTITTKYHTSLLGLVGVDEISVEGVGQARLVPGVSTADPAPTS